MDRLDEIRQRTEAGGLIRRIDMKYLLSEVDRLNTIRAEYASNNAEITINGRQYVPKARAEAAEAERDAAVEDLKISAHCRTCAKECGLCEALSKRDHDGGCKDYEWRGNFLS